MDSVKMQSDWAALAEEIDLPNDIALAVATNRPELLKLAIRPMNKAEVGLLLNAMRVIMLTNQNLQKHCLELSQMTEQLTGHFKGALSQARRLQHKAAFQEYEEEEDE